MLTPVCLLPNIEFTGVALFAKSSEMTGYRPFSYSSFIVKLLTLHRKLCLL